MTGMSLSIDQLPNDIAALKQLLLAKVAEFDAKDAELMAAKNGLIVTQLTLEKLKAQIARLRRETFGASSEKIARTLAQLELALEEAEAAKATAIASAPPSSGPAGPPVPAGSAAAESKTGQREEAPHAAARAAPPKAVLRPVRSRQDEVGYTSRVLDRRKMPRVG
jgi:hypothetical protein